MSYDANVPVLLWLARTKKMWLRDLTPSDWLTCPYPKVELEVPYKTIQTNIWTGMNVVKPDIERFRKKADEFLLELYLSDDVIDDGHSTYWFTRESDAIMFRLQMSNVD